MNQIYGAIADLRNASGWVIDTNTAVCLQVAGWTASFIALLAGSGNNRQLRIAPTAFLYQEDEDAAGEFAAELDAGNLALWTAAADDDPDIVSPPMGAEAQKEINDIVRLSRRGGRRRRLDWADAEGIHLAERLNFALLTGDTLQARVAQARNVAVIHKATVLEMMTYDAGLSIPALCDGLGKLIANSSRDDPCALSDDGRNRLRAIYRRQCPGEHIAT